MNILVINAGSSSLKYQLIEMKNRLVLAKGVCGRIGIGGEISHKTHDGRCYDDTPDFPTHTEALMKVIELLTDKEYGVIKSLSEIAAVGHRAVHGGEAFSESVLITDEVVQTISDLSELAPLHNPANVLGIKACQKVLKDGTPQVAVFDTAFHQTMQPKAYLYGLPYQYYEKYHIRKYGFHGTSHRYVSARVAELIDKPISELKIVSCHMGNGSSISAVDGGKSIETTLGFTPLEGLLMGTRSGSVDPSAITYLMEKESLSPSEMSDILNKKSGYLGLSGVSSDDRDLREAVKDGNERAKVTLDIQAYQVKKCIGAYAAAMGGLDAVVFTGGIGEHSEGLRSSVCENMGIFGINLDEDINEEKNAQEAKISTDNSAVEVWIVPTNEELMIALDTERLVNEG